MAKWIDTQAGKMKVDDAGNVINRHPFKYYSVANKIVKVSLNPDGTEGDAKFFVPRTIVSYHPATGEIIGSHAGFVEAVELDGIDAIRCKGVDGIEGLNIEVTALPADFSCEAYKVDVATRGLVRK